MGREDAPEETSGGALVASVPLPVKQQQEPKRVLIVQERKFPSCGLGLRQAAGAKCSAQASQGRGLRAHRTDVRMTVKVP
jgi:hypothetical protein